MRDPETHTGDPGREIPATTWTTLRAAHGSEPELARASLERLARLYWKPIYWHVRLRWKRSNEDAKDLVQGYFVHCLEKGLFASASRERGRFRSYLHATLDNFVRHWDRDSKRLKRGGGVKFLPIAPGEEDTMPLAVRQGEEPPGLDEVWCAALVQEALAILRLEFEKTDRRITFEIFTRHELADGQRPTYEDLAREFGISTHDVGNHLRRAKSGLVRVLRDLVRESVSDEGEVGEEMRALFAKPCPASPEPPSNGSAR